MLNKAIRKRADADPLIPESLCHEAIQHFIRALRDRDVNPHIITDAALDAANRLEEGIEP